MPTDDRPDRAAFERLLLAADLAPLGRIVRAGRLDDLVPELGAELDFPQRTPYHHLTNLDHSLLTAQLLPADLEWRLLGLLHDLGKRRCRTVNPATGHERYHGHGPVGAAMARPILVRLGRPSAEVDRVTRRIARHMDLHLAANDARSRRAIDKVLDKAGADLDALYRLQLADIGAMHPSLAPTKRVEAIGSYARLIARRRERDGG